MKSHLDSYMFWFATIGGARSIVKMSFEYLSIDKVCKIMCKLIKDPGDFVNFEESVEQLG